jgi:hypothetical protein
MQARIAAQRFCEALSDRPDASPAGLLKQIAAELDGGAQRALGAALVSHAEALLRARTELSGRGMESAKTQWLAGECYLAAGGADGLSGQDLELLELGSEHCIYAAIAAKRQGREDVAADWFSRADETCRMMLEIPEIQGSDLARRLSEKLKRISPELEQSPKTDGLRGSRGNEA